MYYIKWDWFLLDVGDQAAYGITYLRIFLMVWMDWVWGGLLLLILILSE